MNENIISEIKKKVEELNKLLVTAQQDSDLIIKLDSTLIKQMEKSYKLLSLTILREI